MLLKKWVLQLAQLRCSVRQCHIPVNSFSKMGVLNKTRCYLIGHMQYVTDGQDWRTEVKTRLNSLNVSFFDPYQKPFVDDVQEGENTYQRIQELLKAAQYDDVERIFKKVRIYDLKCVDISDFVICHIQPKVASWGTAEELSWACRLKRPTFISIEGGKQLCPYWLFGMFPHKYFYNSVDEIITTLEKIDSGSIKIDSERWKLLKPEFR